MPQISEENTERERERERVKMSVKQRKVALMGFRSVGKSSLAIQFVQVFFMRDSLVSFSSTSTAFSFYFMELSLKVPSHEFGAASAWSL